VYVINELGSSITVFAYDAQAGSGRKLQTISTLPGGFEESNTCADIHVHPSGRFVYGSNRGHDSLAIFSIESSTGRLTAKGHMPTQGKTPRNFGIDPSGRWSSPRISSRIRWWCSASTRKAARCIRPATRPRFPRRCVWCSFPRQIDISPRR